MNKYTIDCSDKIIVRDSLELKTFSKFVKKFVMHVILGWFPSKRIDLSPEGVQKTRIIDRKNNKYNEKVADFQTGRIIRNVSEDLSDHK
ncbi:MAG: hypothetical protein WCO06_06020 [Candidatus Roizmanbacteria bacterium]